VIRSDVAALLFVWGNLQDAAAGLALKKSANEKPTLPCIKDKTNN
jgi:hypothetical protein